MISYFRGALAALAFLSRLAPGARIDDDDLGKAMGWLPFVGLILGLLCIGLPWLGVLGFYPYIQAWLALLLLTYFTRALHLDGLTDVCDGMASHFDPERFWEITKDSRIGAFGVAGLVFLLLGQVLIMGELFAERLYGQAIWALVLGRFCGLSIGYVGKHLSRPGLGSLFLAGATRPALLFGLAFTIISGLILATPLQMLGAFIGAAHFQFPLFALARKVKGLNGDFLGASIVTGELGAMLGILIAS